MSRGRAWSPPAARAVSASLRASAPPPTSTAARWTIDARAHLALYRPPCGVDGCRQPSMIWCRCATCRKPLGRCHEHEPAEPLTAVRGAHRCAIEATSP